MFSPAQFFIKNSALLCFLTSIFIIGGIFSYFTLQRNEDPQFKIRTASILTSNDKLTASQVDEYITKPIEEYLLKMEEIEDLRAESLYGKSIIYADLYEKYSNLQPIWDKLRRKVELAKNEIFEGSRVHINDEYGDVYGTLIGVSKENVPYETLYDTTKKIQDEILALKTAGKTEIYGKQEEAVYIRFKNSYLANSGLSTYDLLSMITGANTQKGAGRIQTNKINIELNAKEKIKNEGDIKNILIKINGKNLYLKDVFEIEKTVKTPIETLVKFNGKNALIIGATLKEDSNILKWGKEIQAKIKELKTKYPDFDIEILNLQSEYVKKLTDRFSSSLIESIIGVCLIVFLILGAKFGVLTGFIIAAVIFSTFFAMKIFNIGLDKISLSALIISLGLLADNSVVIAHGILEDKNIKEEDLKERVIKAVQKFQAPLFVVSIAVPCAFLPVFLAKSAVGEYASSLFSVIFITLMFSFFYSTALLPYLIYKFKSFKKNEREFPLARFLKKMIDKSFENPKMVIFFTILAFIISLVLFQFVPKIFFPDSDRNMYEIKLSLKNGTAFNETKNAVEKLEKYLKTNKDTISFSSYTGLSAPRYVLSSAPEVQRQNSAMVLVNVKNYKTVNKNISDTKNFINKNILNTSAIVRKVPLGPPYDAPVEIRVYDPNKDNLIHFANKIENILKEANGVYLVKNESAEFVLGYKIEINENAALMAGLSPNYVFNYLGAIYDGLEIASYYRNNIKIPVILKGEKNFIINPDNFNSVTFYSKEINKLIPIKQIASIKPYFTNSKILRRNNMYTMTVQGWINETTTSDAVIKEIAPKLNKIKNLKYEFGGIAEKSKKGNSSVLKGIPLAFGIIFAILLAFFNGFKKPFIIFLCAIAALLGANIGLFVTGQHFGFMTFLGYISLAGICISNGVVLLNDACKKSIKEAAKSRVEPVLLTALTTIFGLFPLWIKNDPMFSSLAVSIIFGLISSILITLLFLPCLYYILEGKE